MYTLPSSAMLCSVPSFLAYLACAFCGIVGSYVSGVVRFICYGEAVVADRGTHEGERIRMGHNDADRQYGDDDIRALAVAAATASAEGNAKPQKTWRFKGLSPLLSLGYVDAKRLWIVPFCHAFYLGVLKDFLQLILAKQPKRKKAKARRRQQQQQQEEEDAPQQSTKRPRRQQQQQAQQGQLEQQHEPEQHEQEADAAEASGLVAAVLSPDQLVQPAAKKLLQERGQGITLHPQFGRPYRDIVSKLGSWQMEDFARGMEVFLPLLFRPSHGDSNDSSSAILHDNTVKAAFGHLRRFWEFHAQVKPSASKEEHEAAAAVAAQELLAYSTIAERVSSCVRVRVLWGWWT